MIVVSLASISSTWKKGGSILHVAFLEIQKYTYKHIYHQFIYACYRKLIVIALF